MPIRVVILIVGIAGAVEAVVAVDIDAAVDIGALIDAEISIAEPDDWTVDDGWAIDDGRPIHNRRAIDDGRPIHNCRPIDNRRAIADVRTKNRPRLRHKRRPANSGRGDMRSDPLRSRMRRHHGGSMMRRDVDRRCRARLTLALLKSEHRAGHRHEDHEDRR
jgi:hypothetical protein